MLSEISSDLKDLLARQTIKFTGSSESDILLEVFLPDAVDQLPKMSLTLYSVSRHTRSVDNRILAKKIQPNHVTQHRIDHWSRQIEHELAARYYISFDLPAMIRGEASALDLRTWRRTLRLPKRDAARELGIHQETLRGYEVGRSAVPSEIAKLAGLVWRREKGDWYPTLSGITSIF